MQVLTNSFAAEFGRGLGAVVLASTKSGTNETYGNVYWFYSNSAMNARDYFSNAAGSHLNSAGQQVPNVAKAASKTDRLGFTLGGPVEKDNVFSFASFEHYRASGSNRVTKYVIPSPSLTRTLDASFA